MSLISKTTTTKTKKPNGRYYIITSFKDDKYLSYGQNKWVTCLAFRHVRRKRGCWFPESCPFVILFSSRTDYSESSHHISVWFLLEWSQETREGMVLIAKPCPFQETQEWVSSGSLRKPESSCTDWKDRPFVVDLLGLKLAILLPNLNLFPLSLIFLFLSSVGC